MLDIRTARDRAVRRAVETGEMPNLDLIHQIQKTEGHHPCFGRCEGFCGEVRCRWHGQCMALSSYSVKPAPSGGRRLAAPQRLPRLHDGGYRDGVAENTQPTEEEQTRRPPTAVLSPAPHLTPAGR